MTYLNKQRLKNWTINLLILLAGYVAIQAFLTRDAPTQGAAPPLTGITLDRKAIDLAQLKGKPVLIQFWATWCGICRSTHGFIDNIAEDYEVITIASQSGSSDNVAKHVKEYGITAPVLVDHNGVLAKRFGIKGFPTMFVIDKQGRIYDAEVGFTTEWGLRFRLWMANLNS